MTKRSGSPTRPGVMEGGFCDNAGNTEGICAAAVATLLGIPASNARCGTVMAALDWCGLCGLTDTLAWPALAVTAGTLAVGFTACWSLPSAGRSSSSSECIMSDTIHTNHNNGPCSALSRPYGSFRAPAPGLLALPLERRKAPIRGCSRGSGPPLNTEFFNDHTRIIKRESRRHRACS
jgi:hypothetical protein